MGIENYFHIIDLGNSNIRFSVFDSDFKKKFSENIYLNIEEEFIDTSNEIQNVIKKAEKNISSHIKDIILTLDSKEIFTINISLAKRIEKKLSIKEIYNSVLLELNQIINSNYNNINIIHVILDRCIVGDKILNEFPVHKLLTNNAKFEFKVLCFPKKLLNDLKIKFNKINLNIKNIFCSSYIKTLVYQSKLEEKIVSFLEIGFERSCLAIYKKNKLKFMSTIPIGGHHITKDISKIFSISLKKAEDIKKSFNQSETEFSYKTNNENIKINAKDLINNNISIDILKKVILYRVQEIIDLIFKTTASNKLSTTLNNSNLYLIGGGSKLLNNNSFHLSDKFKLKSINSYKETDDFICNCALKFYLNQYQVPKNVEKKQGLFQKFFNYFGK